MVIALEILIIFLIIFVGLVLRGGIIKTKRILLTKEMKEVCDYLNDKSVVLVRSKDCRKIAFHAHVVRSYHNDIIIIDLDE